MSLTRRAGLSRKTSIVEPKPKPTQDVFCVQNVFGTNVYPRKITFPPNAEGKHMPQNLQALPSCCKHQDDT